MMKKFFIFCIILFITLSSCDVSLSEEDSGVFVPEEVVTPISGLRPYAPVKLVDVIDENRNINLPEEFVGVSDEYVLTNIGFSLFQFFENGFLKALIEGLGLDLENIFNSASINPRSITGKAELHVTDEGVKLKHEYYNIAEATINYLDVIAEGESSNFLKFLFNTLDSSEWPYSQKSANMSGNIGLSMSLGVYGSDSKVPENKTLEKASGAFYLDADLNNIKLGSITAKDSEGNVSSFYFPSYGTMKFKIEFSVAQSVLTLCEDLDNVEGYPSLDKKEPEYNNYYVPNRIWLSVKESSEFNVREVFNLVKKMVGSSGSIQNEAIWNKLCGIIWKNQSGPYITLGIDLLENETGEVRSVVIKDYALLQFLF